MHQPERPHPADRHAAGVGPAAVAIAMALGLLPDTGDARCTASMTVATTSQGAPNAPPENPAGHPTTPPPAAPPAAPQTPTADPNPKPAEAAKDKAPATSAAAEKPVVPSPDPERVRAEKEEDLRRRFVPEELTADQLATMAAAFGVPEASMPAFAQVCERYRQLNEAARRTDSQIVLRLLPAAYRYDPHESEFVPVHTPVLLDVFNRRDAMRSRIDEAETYLDRELRNLGDPTHRAQARLARAARAETLFAHPSKLPGARVNLLELLPKAGLGESDMATLDVSLDRYAEEYLRALAGRDRALRSLEQSRAEALVGLGPEWRAGRTIDEARGVERELARYDVNEVRSDVELRDLNASTIERIRRTLPPQQARRVLVAWQSAVHPELFEEDRLSRIVMERFLGIAELASDVQGLAIDRFLQLEEQLWPLGQQAVEIADNILVADRLPPTDAAQVRIALEQQIHKIQVKRRKVVRDALGEMAAWVPPTAPELGSLLVDTKATLDAQDEASRFLMTQLAQRQRELETLLAMGETPATAAEDAPPPGTKPSPETAPVGPADEHQPSEAPVPPPPGAGQQDPPAGDHAGQSGKGSRANDRPRRDGRGSRR